MGWKDAPLVDEDKEKKPAWMSAPTVDEETQPEPTLAQPEPEKKGILGTLGEAGKKSLAFVGDVLSASSRALGTLRTNPETGEKYEFKNKESNLLRPEIEKTKKAVEQSTPMSQEDYLDQAMITGTMPTFTPEMQKETAKGLTEFVGSSLADPLSYIGAPIKGAGMALKKAGKIIEAPILAKGNKSILKKEGKTASEMAETALKENVGGSLNRTINKIDEKFEVVENNIQNILNKSVKENPNLKVNVDDAADYLVWKLENGQVKNAHGMTPEVINEIKKLKNENATYGYTGSIPVDKANELKRIVGKKAFKSGVPTSDTKAKELAYDLLDLELKDEIANIVPAIKAQNAEYKKLIPIQQMAKNRRFVSEGNEPIRLKTTIAAATQNWPLVIADLASTSGHVAQGAYNVGKPLAKTSLTAGLPLTAAQQTINQPFKSKQKVKLAQPITKPEDFLIGKNR